MKHNMILSASGWRKVFAESGKEEDKTAEIGSENKVICSLIGDSFSEYLKKKLNKEKIRIVVATDTRPTGKQMAQQILHSMIENSIEPIYIGTAAAPEIMAFARGYDGFAYISASHNPIGHNGLKFGFNDGGVIPGSEAKVLAEIFEAKCESITSQEFTKKSGSFETEEEIPENKKAKALSLKKYTEFVKTVISGTDNKGQQKKLFSIIKKAVKKTSLEVVCDMNGSARTLSIDKKFLASQGIKLNTFNDIPGQIEHAIIPEPENLIHCAKKMTEMHQKGNNRVILGYMPDCDGDRGNIVYWDKDASTSKTIQAQEVFALCVMAELAFEIWKNPDEKKLAVAVNCPTSMRIDEICEAFGASLFRAEVGEANVVNLAREKMAEGYNVRIYGEGSNGGNITNPSAVRDPVASIFAIIKLLAIRDTKKKTGLFHLWCKLSGQENLYTPDYTLHDILASLPAYTTTGVSEHRALKHVETEDKGVLKEKFKKVFTEEWEKHLDAIRSEAGIYSYEVITTNGTKETRNAENWNNGNGGLKIMFFGENGQRHSYIWMRPSGTEPVFRILCDMKGKKPELEARLLEWEAKILEQADRLN